MAQTNKKADVSDRDDRNDEETVFFQEFSQLADVVRQTPVDSEHHLFADRVSRL